MLSRSTIIASSVALRILKLRRFTPNSRPMLHKCFQFDPASRIQIMEAGRSLGRNRRNMGKPKRVARESPGWGVILATCCIVDDELATTRALGRHNWRSDVPFSKFSNKPWHHGYCVEVVQFFSNMMVRVLLISEKLFPARFKEPGSVTWPSLKSWILEGCHPIKLGKIGDSHELGTWFTHGNSHDVPFFFEIPKNSNIPIMGNNPILLSKRSINKV